MQEEKKKREREKKIFSLVYRIQFSLDKKRNGKVRKKAK